MTVSSTLPMFPGSPRPQLIDWSDLDRDGYNLELLLASTHSGTHLDAPYHFARNGIGVDQIPPERLVGRAILIRIDCQERRNRAITRADIRLFEQEAKGRGAAAPAIPSGADAVVFFTGWQKSRFAKGEYFLANPGLDRSAARYLASKKVGLVGIDSPSIDVGCDSSFTSHRILAESGILIVENLVNLEKIRSGSFDFVMLPMKLKGASGSPVRALALSR